MKNKKIGISLSGGAARGIAHIGVLQALEEANIFPSCISGSSAGSLVGALYAAGHSPKTMLDIALSTNLFKLFRPQLSLGLMDLSRVLKILEEYIPKNDFGVLEKKLFVCITNLEQGNWEIREEGELFKTIIASCSIPFIFKPVKINGQLYVDGGVLNNLPIEPLKPNCDKIIGVNIIPIQPRKSIDSIIEIAERSIDLVVNSNSLSRLAECDVQIEIEGIDKYSLFDFNQAKEIYDLGYEITKHKMVSIKKGLFL